MPATPGALVAEGRRVGILRTVLPRRIRRLPEVPMLLPVLLALAPAMAATPDLEVRAAVTNWRIGAQADLRPGLRFSYGQREDSLLFRDPFLKVQGQAMLTPAFVRGGARVVAEPLAILELQGFVLYDVYFGNAQTLVGYGVPDANYGSNADIRDYVAADPAVQAGGTGWHWGAAGTLKAQAGPVVVALNAEWSRWDVAQPVPGDWFFEREYELLMGFRDDLLATNGLLLYEFRPGPDTALRLGSITTWRKALGDTGDELLRTGLAASVVTWDGRLSPTLVVQAYLLDRAYTEPFPPFTALMVRWSPPRRGDGDGSAP